MPKADPFDTRGYGVGDSAPGAGSLGPISTNPLGRSVDIKGACMQVADIAARDAIPDQAAARDDPSQHRQEGMLCYVQSTGFTYQLQGGIANANWVQVLPASGGAAPTLTANNNTGSALAEGAIVAVDPSGASRVQPFDATSATAPAARYVGIVTEAGGIADAASGEVTIVGLATVRFKAGLTLNNGDEVYGSTTPGEATNLTDLVANPPPSGGVRHRLGVVLDQSTYAGQQTALCVVHPGQRREEP